MLYNIVEYQLALIQIYIWLWTMLVFYSSFYKDFDFSAHFNMYIFCSAKAILFLQTVSTYFEADGKYLSADMCFRT